MTVQRQGAKILVVEDNDAQRKTLCDILEHEGFDPVAFASAGDALAATETDEFPVAILDQRLPDRAGIEILDALRARGCRTRVIMHTAYGSFESAKRAVNLGAFAYVEKLGDPEELVRHVHRAARDQMVEAIRVAEGRLRTLMENAPDVILQLDRAGRIAFVNRAESFFEVPPVQGAGILDTIAETDRERFGAALREVFETGESRGLEVRAPGQEGDLRWCACRIGPVVVEGDVESAILIARDVSERKRSEAEREQLETQLRQAQKMEALGQLAGGIAHDFNNLLTAILGNAELMDDILERQMEGDPPSSLTKAIEQVRQAGQRAASLTAQLLAFCRRQVRRPLVLDPNEAVEKLETMLRRLIGEHIRLETSLTEGIDHVYIDAGQLEQVLLNLALNARDAMPDGGDLLIRTRERTLDPDEARRQIGGKPGPYVLLEIQDRGSGMSDEILQRIFDPFFTTKPTGKGTGLGLATVYGIVAQAGGFITVDSRLGEGSTFRVFLPAVEAERGEATQDRPVGRLLRGRETILLCEDEEMVRKLAREILESAGYTVLVAGDGRQALELERQRDELPIHLLVTDTIMPGMNGRELATRFLDRRPRARVLYISGYTDDVIAPHGVLDEKSEFLGKPFSATTFLRRVRDVLDQPDPS